MPAQPLQILLIEDSASDAMLMQARLRSVSEFDFAVDHVTRLSEAVEKLSNQHYDAVLLDLNLPDSIGLETVSKTREAAENTPIIVLTAMEDRSIITGAVENGADSYLIKDKADGNRIAVGILWAMRSRQSDSTQRLVNATSNNFSFETFLRNEGKTLRSSVRKGMPLNEALEKLVKAIETGAESGTLLSILLLDDQKHLRMGAAPSLPVAYNDAIDGLAIGPNVGSCGTAAHCGHSVFAVDIETDPFWHDYKDLALAHGLRACWSIPIAGASGEVIGTVATYYMERRGPTDSEKNLMTLLSEVAGSIILAAREL